MQVRWHGLGYDFLSKIRFPSLFDLLWAHSIESDGGSDQNRKGPCVNALNPPVGHYPSVRSVVAQLGGPGMAEVIVALKNDEFILINVESLLKNGHLWIKHRVSAPRCPPDRKNPL